MFRSSEGNFNDLKVNSANFFEADALYSQLNVLYESLEVNNPKTLLSMLLFLKGTGLELSYREVLRLRQTFLEQTFLFHLASQL